MMRWRGTSLLRESIALHWKARARLLAGDIRLAFRVMKHPRAPRATRLAIACTLAYIVSPIQLIPTFLPVIGQLDDVLAIYLCIRFMRRFTPAMIIEECRAPVEPGLRALRTIPDENSHLTRDSGDEPFAFSRG